MFAHMQHMHEHIAYSRQSSSSGARTEEQLRESCAEEVRIARAEVEELRILVSNSLRRVGRRHE